jgi:uncharacterized protein YndB with AHSA1/START domain
MKSEFLKDLDKGTLEVAREFKADLSLVWRAWTEAELLDQWWAPKPWKCVTKTMELKPGGKWIYDMVGPNGERHGALQIFEEIKFHVFFSGKDAFADSEGNINEALPVATWRNSFSSTENGTLVRTYAQYPNPEALKTVLDMGMEEGLQMAQNNLEELLAQLKK